MDQERTLFGNQEMGMATATGVVLVPMTAEMVPAAAKVHLEAFTGYMNTRIGTSVVLQCAVPDHHDESAAAYPGSLSSTAGKARAPGADNVACGDRGLAIGAREEGRSMFDAGIRGKSPTITDAVFRAVRLSRECCSAPAL
jgi:hypothetical protein